MEQIHSSFGLCNKITATVTDYGGNFVKAFKIFQADNDEMENNEDDKVVFMDLDKVLWDYSETSDQ